MDEQLVGYRSQIPGRTYMQSKPRKYGLKIFRTCESSTAYTLNAVAYGGKEGDQVCRNSGQNIVFRLLEPYYGTGRDICTDNFFTSYNPAKLLLENNLTILRTMQTYRRKIPGSWSYIHLSFYTLVTMVCAWLHTKLKKTKNLLCSCA